MIKREKEDEILLKKLGARIATIRKQKNISQVKLSYACDLEKSNMSRIESGNTNPTILLLKKISKNLDISLSELLDF